jgi:hypothetical protein
MRGQRSVSQSGLGDIDTPCAITQAGLEQPRIRPSQVSGEKEYSSGNLSGYQILEHLNHECSQVQWTILGIKILLLPNTCTTVQVLRY